LRFYLSVETQFRSEFVPHYLGEQSVHSILLILLEEDLQLFELMNIYVQQVRLPELNNVYGQQVLLLEPNIVYGFPAAGDNALNELMLL